MASATQTSANDLERLRAAAANLTIVPRTDLPRWTHLPLCVLDAVFSIGVRYGGVISVCHRYALFADLVDPVLPSATASRVIGTTNERSVDVLALHGHDLGPARLIEEVLKNWSRTSTRNGILKAEAAIRYAQILADAEVHTIADVSTLLGDDARLAAVERKLRTIPGNGASDIRLNYLWMLAGDDHHIKPDRMILGWLKAHLGRPVSTAIARQLVTDVAHKLDHTPWALDHAIWRMQSGRFPSK